jgi:hypothetical protein
MSSEKKIPAAELTAFVIATSRNVTIYRTPSTKSLTADERTESNSESRSRDGSPLGSAGCPVFHELFKTRQTVTRYFGERYSVDIRSQFHGDFRPVLGERIEQDDAARKISRDSLPNETPLRNPEYNLKNSPASLISNEGS